MDRGRAPRAYRMRLIGALGPDSIRDFSFPFFFFLFSLSFFLSFFFLRRISRISRTPRTLRRLRADARDDDVGVIGIRGRTNPIMDSFLCSFLSLLS